MSQTIWKFLGSGPHTVIDVEMPIGSQIVHVEGRSADGLPDSAQWWALCDPSPSAEKRRRAFVVLPTGYHLNGTEQYVGTYRHGWLVWHLFELPR